VNSSILLVYKVWDIAFMALIMIAMGILESGCPAQPLRHTTQILGSRSCMDKKVLQ